jgi:MFS family permease
MGFRFVAAAFTTLMAFVTVPTPLWPLYQAHDHFGPTTVTIAFAVMVVGAAASFLTVGHLSDRAGRRRAGIRRIPRGTRAGTRPPDAGGGR